MFTCTGVSFFHGSNDGQKGMGLVVLILVGILPAQYALNPATKASDIQSMIKNSDQSAVFLDKLAPFPTKGRQAMDELSDFLKVKGVSKAETLAAVAGVNHEIREDLIGRSSYSGMSIEQRRAFRSKIYLVSSATGKLIKTKCRIRGRCESCPPMPRAWTKRRNTFRIGSRWPRPASLGFGALIGWKRIVVTVGEKIGKEHLNYGQGASAELVAMGTIRLADWFGVAREHNARALVGGGRNDGGQPFGIAGGDAAEYYSGLGIDASCLCSARRFDLFVCLVYLVPRIRPALRSLAAAA